MADTTFGPKGWTPERLGDQSGKTYIITGANAGAGFQAARILLKKNAKVVMLNRSAEKSEAAIADLKQEFGAKADVSFIRLDLSVLDSVREAAEEVLKTVPRIDALINNAGVADFGPIEDTDFIRWRTVMETNLDGVFLKSQAFTSALATTKGAIVNMSSINAQVAIPAIPAYCASKGGVMQLTKVASLALAPHGIRVNAVGPGSIDTAMMAGVNANPEAMARVMSRTPLQRVGTAREIGNIVAFLASDKASYVTGETIYADGGRIGMNYTC